MNFALAIDVGSSSLRSALVGTDGTTAHATLKQIPVEFTVVDGGQSQIDAVWLRRAVESAIDATLAAAGGRMIAVVSMTTFWHSLVVVGSDDVPRTPVFTWADTRSEDDARALRDQLDATAVHQRTGCILHPSYLPAKIAWLRTHRPDVLDRCASLVSFAQYCTGVWLGTRASSVSMASASGMFDTRRMIWDAELAAVLGIDTGQLGPLVAGKELLPPVSGEYAARWPLLRGVPWRAPIGDGAASNAGAGCISADRIAVMIGTSGAMRCCAPAGAESLVPDGLWRYRLDGTYILTGGALSDGGNAFAWLRDTLVLPSEAELEDELAGRQPGEHRLVVLPFWSGERSLGWVGDATAAVIGMRLHTNPVDIVHAVIEAITYRFARVFDLLRAGGETIVATGAGLLASPAWMQIIADVTGNRVVASGVPEASLRGAALVGLRDIAAVDANVLANAPLGAAYEPRPGCYERHRVEMQRQQELYAREIGPHGNQLLARQTR